MPDADGIIFSVNPHVDVEAWPRRELLIPNGRAAHVGPLLQLLDDGTAVQDGDRLRVPHQAIAELSSAAIAGLGLPRLSPHTLIIESGQFGITDAEFRFEVKFRDATGRGLEPPARTGCIAAFGDNTYVLHEPQFSVLEAVDRFNATAPEAGSPHVGQAQVNVRLNQIAKLHELLDTGRAPGGDSAVTSDEYLRDFRVVVPTQFTLSLSRSEDGVVIDPELLVGASSSAPGTPATDLAVPSARQRDFAARFRKITSVRSTYALGGNWFVALPAGVEKALRVVKDVQQADPGTKARFATHPQQFLKARLEGVLPESELDAVFFDGDYGERVSGVGLWQPKVLPWLKPQTQSWLPVEECGLTVGDTQFRIPPDQIEAATAAVRAALAAGEPSATISGHPVPATEETLGALAELSRATTSSQQQTASPVSATATIATDAGQKVVLLIKDNLEAPTFSARCASRPGIKGRPRTLRSSLLAHQLFALDWLQEHWTRGTTGALLADDMGLGKTFEALAFICWLREQVASGLWARTPVLIVAPTGLLENWRGEMDKHVSEGGLGAVVRCWGPGLAQIRRSSGKDTIDGIPVLDTQELAAADVVLTTYETLRDYQHSFCRVNWSVAIFDEAQKIKNPQTLATTAAKAVANKAALAIALTGTPVENRLSDLWCIVDTVQPLRLGSLRQFVQTYEAHGPEAIEARRTLRKTLVTGMSDAPMLMLRRLKKDHLPGLPKVTVHRFEEPMPPSQASAYTDVVLNAKAAVGDRGVMLRALHEMRSISLHPDFEAASGTDDFIEQSARVKRLIKILDAIHERGEKALVFVEFHAIQAVLIELVQTRYNLASAPFVINGEVPGDRRKRRVEEFQSRPGFDVMLLSPRAGGVGLTLTAANHVVHLARWWNPAVEDQCTDRVNRIGQTREVHVYLPLAKHPTYGDQSFDLLLDALLERKRAQSEDTLTPPDASDAEITALFEKAVG